MLFTVLMLIWLWASLKLKYVFVEVGALKHNSKWIWLFWLPAIPLLFYWGEFIMEFLYASKV